MRLNQPEPHGEEGGRLKHPPLKLLQGDGHVQELPFLLIGEVRLDELLRVCEEVEIVEPWRQQMETADRFEAKLTAGVRRTKTNTPVNQRGLQPLHHRMLNRAKSISPSSPF